MIVNNIDTKDISAVVQGAINKDITKFTLKSIRKYLPGAKIILSTWEGSDVSNLEYDDLLLNKDPGGQDGARGKGMDNTNRQIVSTLNGLKKSKTKYTIKIRTDFILIGNNFLKFFGKFNKYSNDKQFKLFNNRILIPAIYKYPFWMLDFVFFGETEDLIKLYDIPLRSQEEANWFKRYEPIDKTNLKETTRYFPEIHILVNCIAKNIPNIFEKFKDHTDRNEDSEKISHNIFMNSFLPIGMIDGMSVMTLKDSLKNLNDLFIEPSDFLLYQEYYNENIKIPNTSKGIYKMFKISKNKPSLLFAIEREKMNLKRHCNMLFNTHFLRKFVRWFREPFSVIFYAVKIAVLKTLYFFKKEL